MSNNLLLLAFGFGNLALLGWLAAAAAPLLIHLWSRRRFRETQWAAMQFLLAAMRRNARRLQLQQWLLLVVRTLIIALVVLALAEPYGEQLVAGGGSMLSHKILVIDGSYSMAYRDGEMSRFDYAKQLAASLVRDSRPTDVFTVILMAEPARIVSGSRSSDRGSTAEVIESLAYGHTGADLAGAIELAHDAVSDAINERATPQRQEVYFLSDLQRATWVAPENRTQSANGATQSHVAALAEHASLAVIDVGEERFANLAITDLATPEPLVTTGRDTLFDATLHQFGQRPRGECIVELLVDQRRVAEQTVDVPAGSDATVRFSHRFPSTGQYTVAVRAAADDLPIDDARWLVVPVRDAVRVLCVAGGEGAARYVAEALNPDPAGSSPIRPVVVSESELAELELSDFDCIFMCNVGQLTPGEAQRLTRYVKAGGGVVIFLGDRVSAESYNAFAPSPGSQAASGNESLLPARIGEVRTSAKFGLDPLNYRHPIVAPFRGRERAGLLTTPVARYFQVDPSEADSDIEVAAAIPNGDPFIVTAPLSRGRIVLVATDASLASIDPATDELWTHWPTWPSFLPIVREMLAYASGGRQQAWQHRVGTIVRGNSDLGSASIEDPPPASMKIVRPDGTSAPASIESTPAGWSWTYGNTNLSGIYQLQGEPPHRETRHFAVNVDTAESDLMKAAPQDLPAELFVHQSGNPVSHDDADAQLSRVGWDQSLLWIAFALMFVESCLAWQFGRGMI